MRRQPEYSIRNPILAALVTYEQQPIGSHPERRTNWFPVRWVNNRQMVLDLDSFPDQQNIWGKHTLDLDPVTLLIGYNYRATQRILFKAGVRHIAVVEHDTRDTTIIVGIPVTISGEQLPDVPQLDLRMRGRGQPIPGLSRLPLVDFVPDLQTEVLKGKEVLVDGPHVQFSMPGQARISDLRASA